MLPNAMLPILTVAGLNLGALLGGTVIIEQVFSWPGLGSVLLTAVSTRDFPVVQAGLLVVALAFIVVNLIVDLAYAVLDPRVRFS
jgi:peptide/nickel transport system permease protein